MNEPVLELSGAGKTYSAAGRGTVGVTDVSLRAFGGSLVLLLGPSGSGKTTLLTLMAGLVAPSSGSVMIAGERLDARSMAEVQELRTRNIGVVFQSFNLIDALTALENVALVLRFAGAGRKEALRRGMEVLAAIGIGHVAAQPASELSQGEKQRVAIARAVANRPKLVLADEPTASLDSSHGLEIIEILLRYSREACAAVIVATHDERLTARADRIIRLRDGRISSGEEGRP